MEGESLTKKSLKNEDDEQAEEEEGNGIKQLRVREDVSKEEDNLPKNTKIAAKLISEYSRKCD